MKRIIIISFITIILFIGSSAGTTVTYFTDTETSAGNTITAGTLDLTVNCVNTDIAKICLANMSRCTHAGRTFVLKNIGTIDGYLDITNVTIKVPEEKTCSPDDDETGDNVNIKLFFDKDKDGVWDGALIDELIYRGPVSGLLDSPSLSILNKLICAGSKINLQACLDWSDKDFKGGKSSDSMTITIEFRLNPLP